MKSPVDRGRGTSFEGVLRPVVASDDRVLLPIDATLAGEAFSSKGPRLRVGAAELLAATFSSERDRYRRAMKSGMEVKAVWRFAVPVVIGADADRSDSSEELSPKYVVVLESNQPIENFGLDDDVLREMLAELFSSTIVEGVHVALEWDRITNQAFLATRSEELKKNGRIPLRR